eukprot:TRINITY_DN8377_c0_g2_i1.p1 TRINITY_DN8377_c0_g2~~TRINITY_DN8377_c0_g2_i1.p1  ORF type:complete len:504 (-),score=106.96 TRINITY_DN8377_c0_g2_i1:902-2413(-)
MNISGTSPSLYPNLGSDAGLLSPTSHSLPPHQSSFGPSSYIPPQNSNSGIYSPYMDGNTTGNANTYRMNVNQPGMMNYAVYGGQHYNPPPPINMQQTNYAPQYRAPPVQIPIVPQPYGQQPQISPSYVLYPPQMQQGNSPAFASTQSAPPKYPQNPPQYFGGSSNPAFPAPMPASQQSVAPMMQQQQIPGNYIPIKQAPNLSVQPIHRQQPQTQQRISPSNIAPTAPYSNQTAPPTANSVDGGDSFSFFQFPGFQTGNNTSGSSSPMSIVRGNDYSLTSSGGAPSSPGSNATAFPNLYLSSLASANPSNSPSHHQHPNQNVASVSVVSNNPANDSHSDEEYEEQTSDLLEEQDFTEEYDSTKRKERMMGRMIQRLERSLQRLNSALARKNKVGAARANELLEKQTAELIEDFGGNGSLSQEANRLLEQITRATNYYRNEFQAELQKIDAEREQMHAQYRKTILDLQHDVAQSADQLNASIKMAMEREEADARATLDDLRKSSS